MRIVVFAVHPLVMGARDGVPQMADHGVDEEQLARFVPIHAPGVCCAAADDLEDLPRGMVAPDAAVDLRAFGRQRARNADVRIGLNAVPAVKPAVRPPAQAVGDIVPNDAFVEAVEHHLGLAVRNVVAVAVGDEQEPRRTKGPDAAKTDFDAGQFLALVPKDGVLIGPAVVIGVFENDDAVALRQVEIDLRVGVRVVFGDPQAAAGIRRNANRLPNDRLGREERDMKTGRNRHARRGLLGRHQGRMRVLAVRGSNGRAGSGAGRDTHQAGTKGRRETNCKTGIHGRNLWKSAGNCQGGLNDQVYQSAELCTLGALRASANQAVRRGTTEIRR